jgi:hypothetical protein
MVVGVVVVRCRVIGRVVGLVLRGWGREGVSPGVGLARGERVVFGLALGVGFSLGSEEDLVFQVVDVVLFLSFFLSC